MCNPVCAPSGDQATQLVCILYCAATLWWHFLGNEQTGNDIREACSPLEAITGVWGGRMLQKKWDKKDCILQPRLQNATIGVGVYENNCCWFNRPLKMDLRKPSREHLWAISPYILPHDIKAMISDNGKQIMRHLERWLLWLSNPWRRKSFFHVFQYLILKYLRFTTKILSKCHRDSYDGALTSWDTKTYEVIVQLFNLDVSPLDTAHTFVPLLSACLHRPPSIKCNNFFPLCTLVIVSGAEAEPSSTPSIFYWRQSPI